MRYAFYTLAFLTGIIISFPAVALLLLTSWDGRTTLFGNARHGRGNEHFSTPTNDYWQEFKWLTIRNPVNNLCELLAAPTGASIISGNTGIIDQREQGSYRITMGGYWEYGMVKFYGKRCLRIRLGWKILGNQDGTCDYVLSVIPFMRRA